MTALPTAANPPKAPRGTRAFRLEWLVIVLGLSAPVTTEAIMYWYYSGPWFSVFSMYTPPGFYIAYSAAHWLPPLVLLVYILAKRGVRWQHLHRGVTFDMMTPTLMLSDVGEGLALAVAAGIAMTAHSTGFRPDNFWNWAIYNNVPLSALLPYLAVFAVHLVSVILQETIRAYGVSQSHRAWGRTIWGVIGVTVVLALPCWRWGTFGLVGEVGMSTVLSCYYAWRRHLLPLIIARFAIEVLLETFVFRAAWQ